MAEVPWAGVLQVPEAAPASAEEPSEAVVEQELELAGQVLFAVQELVLVEQEQEQVLELAELGQEQVLLAPAE